VIVHSGEQLVDRSTDWATQVGLLFESSDIDFLDEGVVRFGRIFAELDDLLVVLYNVLGLMVVASSEAFKSILLTLEIDLSLVRGS
jgi:hypothetical protein